MKEYRPPDWNNKNPCLGCPKKAEDEYGLFCDLACGLFTRFVYREDGADMMLKALKPLILEIAPSSKLIDVLYKEK